MTSPAYGLGVATQTSAVAGSAADDTGFRSGIVKQWDGINVYVDVSGQLASMTATSPTALQQASYIESYRPILGDVVLIAKQGSKWIVLGRFNAVGSNNVIPNPSFETDAVGTSPPSGWGVYHDPSSTLTSVVAVRSSNYGQPVDGSQYCSVEPTAGAAGVKSSTDYVYSTAFAVQPGQRWTAVAWARCSQGVSTAFAPALVQVGIQLTWQVNQGDVPPTAISGSGFTFSQISASPDWTRIPLSTNPNGFIVPATANWGRLSLVSTQYNNSTTSTASVVHWDKCVARQVA